MHVMSDDVQERLDGCYSWLDQLKKDGMGQMQDIQNLVRDVGGHNLGILNLARDLAEVRDQVKKMQDQFIEDKRMAEQGERKVFNIDVRLAELSQRLKADIYKASVGYESLQSYCDGLGQ